jgi:hypothetical protein
VLAVLLLAVGCEFKSDDFSAPTLGTRWKVVDPVGDGTVALGSSPEGPSLELTVPAGTNHDPWTPNESLRAVQRVDDGDLGIEAKFDSVPSERYQTQGLLFQEDLDTFLRFDYFWNGSTLRAFVAVLDDGIITPLLNTAVPVGPSLYLRVDRTGDTWSLATSVDGDTWVGRTTFDRALALDSVGVFAGNFAPPGGSAPAYTARVDYVFNTARPIEDEDGAGTGRHLEVEIEGGGSVTREPDQPTYDDGQEVVLTAVADPGWAFVGWSGAASGSDNPTVVTIEGPTTVGASFTLLPDDQPPQISDLVIDATSSGAQVEFTTDEFALGAVSYGLTPALELGVVDELTPAQAHDLSITGLDADTEYHLHVSATDAAGNSSTSDIVTFTTAANTGPMIDVWYGDTQAAGVPGRPQTWVNIVGNVSDPFGVASLSYSLNGGPPQPLSLGPDTRRLLEPGDFNVEIDFDALAPGANTVEIVALDDLGAPTSRVVTVLQQGTGPWPLPYATSWATASSVTEQAHVIDGRWSLDGATVRTEHVGYDRLLAIGDRTWSNYEVTVPITLQAVEPLNQPPSNGAALGLLVNWQGHSAVGSEQPRRGFEPLGAYASFRWGPTGSRRWQLIGSFGQPQSGQSNPVWNVGETYILKVRSETVAEGLRVSMKYWLAGTAEPAAYQLTSLDADTNASGSVVLLAHHVDAAFGDVVVEPLGGGAGG